MRMAISDAAPLDQTRKMLERAVVGAFGIGRKDTGRQLPIARVIGQAFAAVAFATAGLVDAVAACEVCFLMPSMPTPSAHPWLR